MSDFTHLVQKLVAERTRLNQTSTHRPQSQSQSPTSAPPPPPCNETIASEDPDSEWDSDDENDTTPPEENHPQFHLQLQPCIPVKLTINAAHSIQGNNNLIPTSVSPLADASRFGQLLMVSVNQINNAAMKQPWGGSIDLTINCGVTVVGDRNVVGFVGVRPKAAAAAATADVGLSMGDAGCMEKNCDGGAAAAGVAVTAAKRRAEEQHDSATEQPIKKVARGILGGQ